MTSPNLKSSSAATQQAQSVLGQHVDQMRRTIQQAQDIEQQLANSYQATASTTFQRAINSWNENVQQIMGMFTNLQESFGQGTNVIASQDEHFANSAGSWAGDAGNSAYSALTGS
jgi:hypothetical protein